MEKEKSSTSVILRFESYIVFSSTFTEFLLIVKY